jgi:acyl-CoA dehydrogenase
VSSAERRLLAETVRELIARSDRAEPDAPGGRAVWSPALWASLEELGFTRVSVDERAGGSGGELADAIAIARAAGVGAAPVPILESLFVGPWLLAAAGLELPPAGIVTAAPRPAALALELDQGALVVSGELPGVPWGRVATTVAALAVQAGDGAAVVVAIPVAGVTVERSHNIAGEPRDRIVATGLRIGGDGWAPAAAGVDAAALRARGALGRAAAIVGALEQVLEMTVRHAREREQFGRPIARFQAVAQQLAALAGEAAAAAAALETVEDALADLAAPLPHGAIATAKIVAGRAATVGSAIAHQVHGAVGITTEHPLGQHTRRLWAWRDEYGSEREWAGALGRELAGTAPDELWRRLAG